MTIRYNNNKSAILKQISAHGEILIPLRIEGTYNISINYLDQCFILNAVNQEGIFGDNTLVPKQGYKHID